MNVIERHESAVRSYCRSFPRTFTQARGHEIWDREGRRYLDFFAGAGALNYGHNHPELKRALLDYVESDGIAHSLDMATGAKEAFLERFHQVILEPRGLSHRVMFPGPTGTNAVEAALKLARKVTGRTNVLSFTNGFHGMTLGSLSVTGNGFKRAGAGLPLNGTTTLPFDGYSGAEAGSLELVERLLEDSGSGVDAPAAAIVETVQGEGGLNVASRPWLQGLEQLLRRHGALLILDDIQAGCGRTGRFFSFEEAGLRPDLVCLSKSISGYGLPMSLVLIRPDLDDWEPGEHNGTFRGNNHAFVTATAALEFWAGDELERETARKAATAAARLEEIAAGCGVPATARGRGLMRGIAFEAEGLAGAAARGCFERGLILETSGAEDQVLKLLPPLTLGDEALDEGLGIIEESVRAAVQASAASAAGGAS